MKEGFVNHVVFFKKRSNKFEIKKKNITVISCFTKEKYISLSIYD